MAKKEDPRKFIVRNKKARHDYFIEETFEAGVSLRGSEVKSLRLGRANLTDAYAEVRQGELFMIGCHISEYAQANQFNHPPRRERKLLMHRREIDKLTVKIEQRGYTLGVNQFSDLTWEEFKAQRLGALSAPQHCSATAAHSRSGGTNDNMLHSRSLPAHVDWRER